MGWLEILPLLKRLLPLLSRVAPMLETFVAARAANNPDTHTAFHRLSGELKSELFATTGQQAEALLDLKQTLTDHTAHLHILSDELNHLRIASAQSAARLEEAEARLATMSVWLKASSALIVLLLIACLIVLFNLFARHP